MVLLLMQEILFYGRPDDMSRDPYKMVFTLVWNLLFSKAAQETVFLISQNSICLLENTFLK